MNDRMKRRTNDRTNEATNTNHQQRNTRREKYTQIPWMKIIITMRTKHTKKRRATERTIELNRKERRHDTTKTWRKTLRNKCNTKNTKEDKERQNKRKTEKTNERTDEQIKERMTEQHEQTDGRHNEINKKRRHNERMTRTHQNIQT